MLFCFNTLKCLCLLAYVYDRFSYIFLWSFKLTPVAIEFAYLTHESSLPTQLGHGVHINQILVVLHKGARLCRYCFLVAVSDIHCPEREIATVDCKLLYPSVKRNDIFSFV